MTEKLNKCEESVYVIKQSIGCKMQLIICKRKTCI